MSSAKQMTTLEELAEAINANAKHAARIVKEMDARADAVAKRFKPIENNPDELTWFEYRELGEGE